MQATAETVATALRWIPFDCTHRVLRADQNFTAWTHAK
jgi:hypothetical protein